MTQTVNEYGEALFLLACEENCVDEWEDELKSVKHQFRENPDYLLFLSSPNIPKSNRTDAINEAFGGCLSEYVMSFLMILCERGHIMRFNECVKEYQRLKRISENSTVAKITSAVELSDEQKNRLKEKLEKKTGRKIKLDTKIDESVVGGLIIEIDGKIIDASIKRSLKEVKDVMNG